MINTLIAVFAAHVLADFVLQTARMVESKRNPLTLLAHGAVMIATAALMLGSVSPWILALGLAHGAIDVAKTFAPRNLTSFLSDQAAHLISLGVFAALFPSHWTTGIWANVEWAPPAMMLAAGAITASRAGGFAIGLMMLPWAASSPQGLPGGGRAIGNLERGLIFLMVISGQASAIGFLIAAKSVLRFGTIGDDRAISEYVIIGTLASFAWAMVAAFVTVAVLAHLPALGIPDLTP